MIKKKIIKKLNEKVRKKIAVCFSLRNIHKKTFCSEN